MILDQILAFILIIVAAVTLGVFSFRYHKKTLETRDFPIFASLADEVGRVAEEGALVHVALGSGSLIGENAMTSLAALQGLNALINLSAAYDTPPLLTTGDPMLYLLAGDWLRRAYIRLGNTDRYKPIFVQFSAPTPMTYAAMAATNFHDTNIGSSVILGAFDQEVSLLTEAASRKGIYGTGGTTSILGLSALYPSLGKQQLVMGEELFSASTKVLGKPVHHHSLWAQDILRWAVIAGMLGAAFLSLLGVGN